MSCFGKTESFKVGKRDLKPHSAGKLKTKEKHGQKGVDLLERTAGLQAAGRD